MRNRVQLIGNLGTSPELKEFENGTKLVRVSMATNETYRNAKGDKVTDTQWHNLVAWGNTADILNKYTSKGSELAIEGKLTTNSYEDKDGNKRYNTEIVVNDIVLLGKKGE